MIRGGHFEFQQNLYKSPAHRYIVGNVIWIISDVKFLRPQKKMIKIFFCVQAPTKKLKLIRGGHFEFQ